MTAWIPFVSDRLDFEDPDVISQHTHQRLVDFSTKESRDIQMGELYFRAAGAKVLVLIHGYNVEYDSALATYESYIEKLQSSYDIIIGYLWPGGDHGTEYFSARNRVVHEIDIRLLAFLASLKGICSSVDILAHSMGCRLSLEALELAQGNLVRNLFFVAPAIDNEALERGERYSKAIQNAEQVIVFYSLEDEVLQFLYAMAEFDQALGYSGAEHAENLPPNVRIIDVSDVVLSHGGYNDSKFIIQTIRDQVADPAIHP